MDTKSGTARLTCTTCGQANRVPLARLLEAPKCGVCGAALVSGRVAEIDGAVHDKATRADGVPMIVDYWASWCGPCRMMAPEFAKAAAGFEGRVRFAKLDTERFPEVSRLLGIKGIPLVILWANGREVARLPGARPAAEIAAFVHDGMKSEPR
jgi:thioredoxin 2